MLSIVHERCRLAKAYRILMLQKQLSMFPDEINVPGATYISLHISNLSATISERQKDISNNFIYGHFAYNQKKKMTYRL